MQTPEQEEVWKEFIDTTGDANRSKKELQLRLDFARVAVEATQGGNGG